jgi:flagellar biosynthesis/type III secretory pathway M-ring protein FliF/YscJ
MDLVLAGDPAAFAALVERRPIVACGCLATRDDSPAQPIAPRAGLESPDMDWVFYVSVGLVLFVVIVIALAVRYFLMLRLEEMQREEEQEQEARETAEANSGL